MFKLGLHSALSSTLEILIEYVGNVYSDFLEPTCLHENKAETQMETFQMKLSRPVMWEEKRSLKSPVGED